MTDREDKKKGTGTGAVVGAAAGGVAGGAAAGAAVGGMTGPVGAALGAVVGAVVGAVGGRVAAGSDDDAASSSVPGDRDGVAGSPAVHTVIGAFDDPAGAERAAQRLAQAGFAADDVHVHHEQQGTRGAQLHPNGTPNTGGGFFGDLYAAGAGRPDLDVMQGHAYDEAVRRGSAVVVVDAHDEDRADEASALLHEMGAMDVDERARQWRSEGWQPPGGAQQDTAASAAPRRESGLEQEATLNVVEEQLQVGKRTLDRGGVRVIQRVSSKPVRELVRLREEQATVDRHAVDRPANGQELSNFKEGTIEVHETVEQPVVAKTARVVEEVRVGKEVREREETIEDTVRRKDVEIERIGGQGASRTAEDRQRAVASDDTALRGEPRQPAGGDKPRP